MGDKPPKETKRRDREFQLQIVEIERLSNLAISVFTVMIAVMFSLLVSLGTLYSSGSYPQSWLLHNFIFGFSAVGICFVLLMLFYFWIGKLIDKLRKEFIES